MMKYLFYTLLLTISMVSCHNNNKQNTSINNNIVMTSNDTIQVMDLVTTFMNALQDKRYADAVQMVHKVNSESPYNQPEELNNEEIMKTMANFKLLPILKYSVVGYKFKIAYDNEVKCLIVPESNPSLKLNFSIKPVRHFGKWYLCLKGKY